MSPLAGQKTLGDRLRQLRGHRNVSVRRLAELTDFSASFISQVENGQASPSISSLERIAGALGVTLGEFFASPDQRGDAELVIRAGDRAQLTSGWSSGRIEALGPMGPQRALEPVLITLDPGGRSGKRPRAHSMEEFAFVLEGEVRLTLAGQTLVVHTGDAVTIPRGQERLWENESLAPVRILVVSARH